MADEQQNLGKAKLVNSQKSSGGTTVCAYMHNFGLKAKDIQIDIFDCAIIVCICMCHVVLTHIFNI
jgi:hypothetical protein